MGVAEIAALLAVFHRFDRTYHDQMRHDLLDLGETAVENRGRILQYRRARDKLDPFSGCKSFVEMTAGTASKNIGEVLVRRGEGVDAKYAILNDPRRRRRGFVNAKQHHGRLDRDRSNRGRGDPSKARRAASGHDMNRRRDTAHRFAKPCSIEALAWFAACAHASGLEAGHPFIKLHLSRTILFKSVLRRPVR
jgi:hypothetical protein